MNIETAMLRPKVCNEHKFCIGHVPDSPKEVMASRSNIAPMSSFNRGADTTLNGGGSTSFNKLNVNQSGAGLMPININDSNEMIQVSDGGVMQVSFNLGNHVNGV